MARPTRGRGRVRGAGPVHRGPRHAPPPGPAIMAAARSPRGPVLVPIGEAGKGLLLLAPPLLSRPSSRSLPPPPRHRPFGQRRGRGWRSGVTARRRTASAAGCALPPGQQGRLEGGGRRQGPVAAGVVQTWRLARIEPFPCRFPLLPREPALGVGGRCNKWPSWSGCR